MSIVDDLRIIAASGDSIHLLNIYRGVPIAYRASILDVGNSEILVQTDRYQIVCLYHERETYIQHHELSEIVHARVSEIDVHRLQAILTDLEFVDSQIGERNEIRVQPKEPIVEILQPKDVLQSFSGELADVSQGGLGVYIADKNYYSWVYRVGNQVAITFRLPGKYEIKKNKSYQTGPLRQDPLSRYDRDQLRTSGLSRNTGPQSELVEVRSVQTPEITLPGVVSYSHAEASHNRYRVGLRVLPDDLNRQIIAQFISRRQAEIIQELNDIFQLITKD